MEEEKRIFASGCSVVAGVDEVGRGALGGPVSVGVVALRATPEVPPPFGLLDSKLLSPRQREALVGPIRGWATAWSVGHAEAAEIDEVGLSAALRLAGVRAMEALGVAPGVVILDGKHHWFGELGHGIEVITRPKADLHCASVAAASILAKVERDAIMASLSLSYPRYGWAANKGYGTPAHIGALKRFGPCEQHRRSWNIPGIDPGGDRQA